MELRERRRYLTAKTALAGWTIRWKHYVREQQSWIGNSRSFKVYDKWLDSPHRFAKTGWGSCSCRRRRHGNPKIGFGSCKDNGHEYRECVRTRIANRRICREILGWVQSYDPLDYDR